MKNSLLGPLLARIVIISKQIMVVGLTGLGPYGPGRAAGPGFGNISDGPQKPGPYLPRAGPARPVSTLTQMHKNSK